MPSIVFKKDLADAIRKGMPEEVVDLMSGKSMHETGMLGGFYRLINETAGSIEIAYYRGYQAGYDQAKSEATNTEEGGD